jgi:hypothetical protein
VTQLGSVYGFDLFGDWTKTDPIYSLRLGKQVVSNRIGPSIASVEATLRSIRPAIERSHEQIANDKGSIQRLTEATKQPFQQADALAKKREVLAGIERDLQDSPAPAPSWLRHGAPAQTLIYVEGKPRVVEGHRWGDDNYYVVTPEGDVPYLDAHNEDGSRIFDPRPFTKPIRPQPADASKQQTKAEAGLGEIRPGADYQVSGHDWLGEFFRGVDPNTRAASLAEVGRIVNDIAPITTRYGVADQLRVTHQDASSYGRDVSGEAAAGLHDPVKDVLMVAAGLGSATPVTTFHEVWHSVKRNALVRPEEQAVLNRDRPRMEEIIRDFYGASEEEVRNLSQEEVEAHAAGATGFGYGREHPLHFVVRRILDKLGSLIRRVRQVLARLGVLPHGDSFESIMRAFRAGEFKRRSQNGEQHASSGEPNTSAAMWTARRAAQHQTVRERIAETFLDNRERYQDYSIRLKRMQDALEELQGKPLTDPRRPYDRKRLIQGRAPTVRKEFDDAHFLPLVKHMKANGLSLKRAGDFVYALHAPERNQRIDHINPGLNGAGSGMSTADARDIIDRAKADGSYPALMEVARRVQAMRRFEIEQRELMGLISTDQMDEMLNGPDAYTWYAPLSGFEVESEEGPRGAGSASVRGPEWKQALGRKSLAANPIVNMLDQVYRAIDRGERNRYGQSLYNLLKPFQADQIEDFARLDKGELTRHISARTGLVEYRDTGQWRNDPRAFGVKFGGKQRYIIFADEKLAEAAKRMSADQLGFFLGMIRPVTNFVKTTWTHYNPDFLIRHFFFRYPIEAAANSQELKELVKAGGKDPSTFQALRQGYPIMGEAFRAIYRTERGKAKGGVWEDAYRQMQREGGAMKFRGFTHMETTADELKRALGEFSKGPVIDALTSPLRALRSFEKNYNVLTSAMDNALRLVRFKQGLEAGHTPQQAALSARDASVDFQLRGSRANHLGTFFPMGNTAIQTGTRMVGATARSRQMQKVFAGFVTAGFLTSTWNYHVGGKDVDGIPFFDKIPSWERALNFIIMNPFDRDEKGRPGVIKIPMPYNYSAPMVFGYTAGNVAFGTRSVGSMLSDVGHSTVELFSPIGQQHNLVAIPVPDLVRPAVNVYTNKKWTGSNVHPNSYPDEKWPRSHNPRSTAGEGYQAIAQGLNAITGGNEGRRGFIDLWPEDIRELLGNYVGTLVRTGQHIREPIEDALDGQPHRPSHTLLERVVRGTDYDAADGANYREERSKAKARADELKIVTENGNIALARRIKAEHADELHAAVIFKQADKMLKASWKLLRKIEQSNLPADEKKRRVQAIRERQQKIHEMALQRAHKP